MTRSRERERDELDLDLEFHDWLAMLDCQRIEFD